MTAGSTVAVVGLGGVGPAALLGADAAGAERLRRLDLSPQKLAIARELGAIDSFEGRCRRRRRVREATRGGVDLRSKWPVRPRRWNAYRITRRAERR